MEETLGGSQARRGRNEEVANIGPHECQSKELLCECLDWEETGRQEEHGEEPGEDQHHQSEEREGSAPRPEIPTDHSAAGGGPADRRTDRGETPLPLQDSPSRTVPPGGAPNHSNLCGPEAHRNAQRHTTEPCWYCMTSLTTEGLMKLQLDFETVSLPPKGKHVSYQQDPRPHFGVARSARSTPFPLWGCDGPLRREMELEDMDRMSACPHCFLSLPLDTLQWHEAKCLAFEGLKNPSAK